MGNHIRQLPPIPVFFISPSDRGVGTLENTQMIILLGIFVAAGAAVMSVKAGHPGLGLLLILAVALIVGIHLEGREE